jgi:hypothetical protein
MKNIINPYRAPEAPVAEDFIVVQPLRRPTSNFVAAASCFAFSAFLLAFEGLMVWILIDRWSKVGTKSSFLPTHFGQRDLILMTIGFTTVGLSALASLLSGWSFWVRRDRRGSMLFLIALGLFGSKFLLPFLFL